MLSRHRPSQFLTMKRALAVLLTLAVSLPGAAAERRRTAAPPDDSLTITFVESDTNQGSMLPAGNDAWLDLKSVTRWGRRKRSRSGRAIALECGSCGREERAGERGR